MTPIILLTALQGNRLQVKVPPLSIITAEVRS